MDSTTEDQKKQLRLGIQSVKIEQHVLYESCSCLLSTYSLDLHWNIEIEFKNLQFRPKMGGGGVHKNKEKLQNN
jgi:hypothetical protein